MRNRLASQFLPLIEIERCARDKGISLKEAVRSALAEGAAPECFRRNAGLISLQDQLRLLDLPIFIAGVGGLGGEVAAHLTHLGAANLYLCDYDIFEESNSNRQRFCDSSTLGLQKAAVTAEALSKKIPWGDFKPVFQKLSRDNLPATFKECSIVVDCLDSVSGKEKLESMAMEAGIAWLHGSVLDCEGFVCLKSRPDSVLKSLYGTQTNESGAGSVLSHIVGGTACAMIALFMRWLVNPDYSSSLIHLDFSVPEMEQFSL